MEMGACEVRAATQSMVFTVNDLEPSIPQAAAACRTAFSVPPRPSRGVALASALIFAAALSRKAIYDRWAQQVIDNLGMPCPPLPLGMDAMWKSCTN